MAYWIGTGVFTDGGTWSPTNEMVSDFLWAQGHIEHPFTMWFGIWSVMGAPHPGPVYLWVIALGVLASKILPISAAAGAYMSYTAFIAVLVGVGAHLARRVFESRAAGWMYVIAIVSTMSSTRGLQLHGLLVSAGPPAALSLGALMLAFMSLGAKWDKSVLWCAITGGLVLQLRTEFAVVGLGVMFLGVGLSVVRRRQRTGTIAATVVLLAPLVIRLFQEGSTLFVRYISGAREAYELEKGTKRGLLATLELWRLSSNFMIILFMIATSLFIGLGLYKKHWRTRAVLGLMVWLGTLAYIYQSMDLGWAHGTIVYCVPAVVLAGFGRVLDFDTKGLQTCAAVTIVFMVWSAHAGLPVAEVGMNTSPRVISVAERIEVLAGGRGVELRQGDGPVVPGDQGSVLDNLAPVLFELRYRGVEACLLGEKSVYEGGQLISNRFICEKSGDRYVARWVPVGGIVGRGEEIIAGDLGGFWTGVSK